MKRFEEIPHTADWSFRAIGRNLSELFENAAFAIFAMQGVPQGAADSAAETARLVEVKGIDYESLLVNWLTELLWLEESNREVYPRSKVESISPTALRARVFGVPLTKVDKLIKAVTYHNLKIEQVSDGWQVTVVVDV